MNSQNVLQAMIGLAIVTLLLVGCGPQETAPTATSVSEAPAAIPTPVLPTVTPVPPTATPLLPTPTSASELSNGQYFFLLRSAEFSEELSLEKGETGRPKEGFVFLKLVLQRSDVAEEGSPGLSELWACYRDHKSECQQSEGRNIVQGNIEFVFVVDSQDQKYNAIFMNEEWLVFIVPKSDRSFTLHFLDFPALVVSL